MCRATFRFVTSPPPDERIPSPSSSISSGTFLSYTTLRNQANQATTHCKSPRIIGRYKNKHSTCYVATLPTTNLAERTVIKKHKNDCKRAIEMKLAIFTFLFALLTTTAMAVAPHKSVIISYPNDTPQSVVDEAMAKIEKDGGKITHKYSK
jgi:hypothetical protein